MVPSTVPPSTVIYYANRSAHNVNQALIAKESIYTSKLSETVGSSNHVLTRRVESTEEEVSAEENLEFKLPSLRSLFIIIVGNAFFQVIELHSLHL